MALLVVDIGGSAVKYGVWDGESLHAKDEFPTPPLRNDFFAKVKQILDELSGKYEIEGLGLSCPGETDESTGMVAGWSFVPFLAFGEFQQAFSDALGGLPVSMMNDANCAGLAEMRYGVGKGHKNPLFLIIGSGIGLAFVRDGEIVVDTQSEISLLDKLVTTALQLLHGINASPVQMAKVVSVKKFQLPDSIEGKDVFELAKQGDEVAKEQVAKMYQSLAEIIIYLQTIFKPEFFAIGGGLSKNKDLLKNLRQAIDDYLADENPLFMLFRKQVLKEEDILAAPEVKICEYSNDANLIGAALHFYDVQQ